MGSGKPYAAMDQGGGFECISIGVSQELGIGTSAISCNSFDPKTSVVTVFATKDCFISTGQNPTATQAGASYFLPGGIRDFVGVNPADKLSVIQNSSGVSGMLYITEAR